MIRGRVSTTRPLLNSVLTWCLKHLLYRLSAGKHLVILIQRENYSNNGLRQNLCNGDRSKYIQRLLMHRDQLPYQKCTYTQEHLA